MSIRSGVVALIDPVFNGRVYSDVIAPGGLDYPYAGVIDHVNESPAMKGNGKVTAWTRLVQVDVWEQFQEEDPALMEAVVDALDGRRIDGAFKIAVYSSLRVVDPDPSLAHHVVTLSIARPR